MEMNDFLALPVPSVSRSILFSLFHHLPATVCLMIEKRGRVGDVGEKREKGVGTERKRIFKCK